jgi:hypothetical protein
VDGCLSLDAEDVFSRVFELLSLSVEVFRKKAADTKMEAMKSQHQQQSLEEREQWRQQQQQLEELGGGGRGRGPSLPAACLLQALDLKIRHVSE